MNVNFKIVQDTRSIKKNGSYPIKARVTYSRKQKYFLTGLNMTKDNWKAVVSNSCPKKLRKYREFIINFEHRGHEIINEMGKFSFNGFSEKWYTNSTNSTNETDLVSMLNHYASELEKQGRINYASSFSCTSVATNKFLQSQSKSEVELEEIDGSWLRGFQNWIRDNSTLGQSGGTYLRNIRTTFNYAIKNKKVNPKYYPFGIHGFSIPSSNNFKRALSTDQLNSVLKYVPRNHYEDKALDMWKFMFFSNGANFADIARLKISNIKKDRIEFIRKKTARSTNTTIRCLIIEEQNVILNKWGNLKGKPGDFVFEILEPNGNEKEWVKQIQIKRSGLNNCMKKIGETLGFELKLTSYVARHSFATKMKNEEAPIEFIRESLGHSSLNTTMKYLGSFEDEKAKDYRLRLLKGIS